MNMYVAGRSMLVLFALAALLCATAYAEEKNPTERLWPSIAVDQTIPDADPEELSSPDVIICNPCEESCEGYTYSFPFFCRQVGGDYVCDFDVFSNRTCARKTLPTGFHTCVTCIQ